VDAGVTPNDQIGYGVHGVMVSTPKPGLCHVQLVFDTGFTFSADVTFVQQQQESGCALPPYTYTVPTQRRFVVDAPDAACVDAGP
jgi:hypothetical protein